MDLDLDAPGLVGRSGVWAELTALLDPDRPDVRAALLTGEAGIGKTALVQSFAGEARRRGHTVVRAAGSSERARPYAVLGDLLGPHRPGLDDLPAGQRRALTAALRGDEQGIDLLALRSAVCAVLAQWAGDHPVALIVDDVDRVDAPTFDLLLTLAAVITWGHSPVVALFAARADRAPDDLAELLRPVTVPPLTDREADRLLDRLPGAPQGAARLDLLRRAAGNPLALREFADWAELPGAATVFVRRVRELPPPSLRALTLAAAGERGLAVIRRADPALSLAAWPPAEDAGLVTVADGTVRFRHPLVEQAVLDVAGPAGLEEAHRLLAATATDPQRALWHRAAAAGGFDPVLAGELVAAARRDAGAVSAVGLLERAAELLPPEDRMMALVEAARRAAAVGRVRWASAILSRAMSAPAGRQGSALPAGLAAELASFRSWLFTMRGDLAASERLLAEALGGNDVPVGVLGTAAFPAFLLGEGPLAERLRAALARLPARPATWFPRAVVTPDDSLRDELVAAGDPTGPDRVAVGASAGAAAMLLDEPDQAIRLLDPAVRAVADGTATAIHLAAPGAAGWALIDTGRWVEAERMLVPLITAPILAEAPQLRAGTCAQLAVIAYGRGRATAADELLAGPRAETGLDAPALALRVAWARGQAAAATGDHETAFRVLAASLDAPHFWQPLILPDVVAAAVHIGRRDEAAALVARVRDRFAGRWASERGRSRGAAADALLLDDPAAAASALTAILTSDATRRRPFEHAVLAVEWADRLRRAQQPRPAREALIDALDTFERLGAAAWAARVRTELRAEAPAEPSADPFARLTAQQEQIARLAAQGLTNREIGARLFLSPRTVGSHLYRMFPLLGVANRTQLSDLLASRDRRHAEAADRPRRQP